MTLHQYRVVRNSMLDLMRNRETFTAAYYDMRMRTLASDIIGHHA